MAGVRSGSAPRARSSTGRARTRARTRAVTNNNHFFARTRKKTWNLEHCPGGSSGGARGRPPRAQGPLHIRHRRGVGSIRFPAAF